MGDVLSKSEAPAPYGEALSVIADFDPIAMFHAVTEAEDRGAQRAALRRAIRDDLELLCPFFGRCEAAAIKALSERSVRTNEHLAQVSRVFDCAGVERQEAALLAVLEPNVGYRRKVDANVTLPLGVEGAAEDPKVVDPFVLLDATKWIAFLADGNAALRARALEYAALRGKLKVLKTLLLRCSSKEDDSGKTIKKQQDDHKRIVCAAAYGGHVEVLEWLLSERGIRGDETACGAAAAGGRLEAVLWLCANDVKCDASTCAFAARRGHVDILKFLRETKRCPWDERVCEAAARGGHVDVISYAHANGCPWGSTCRTAAEYNKLDVLKYARANACPWDERTCLAALDRGHFDVLEWCCTNACPWPSSLTPEVLDWYHSLSVLETTNPAFA